mgnify:FL=1
MKNIILLFVVLCGHSLEARQDQKLREAVAPCLLQHGQTLRESLKEETPEVPGPNRPVMPALLQTRSAGKSGLVVGAEMDPSFFDAFADAESTWNADGGAIHQVTVSNAASASQDVMPTVVPSQWFAETPSAGPKEAWQTYDAESQDASWRASSPEWRVLDFGRIQQGWDPVSPDRMKSRSDSHGKDATWFDKSVKQQDYFGRPRAPTPESAEFYLEWSQTSRTAELSCGPPGCVANTSLKAFESGDLEYKMCTLSVMVHPTDFDDEYNVEKIEWIVINGKEALRDFSPRAPKGCETNGNLTGILDSTLDSPDENDPSLLASNVHAFNNSNKSHDSKKSHGNTKSSVARNNSKSNLPLYPCIRDLPLEGLVGDDGQVHVSGKISTAVDECAVNGNHFSGLVSITCFTRPTTTLPPLPATTTTTTEAPEKVKQEFKTKDSAHFRCKDPGCSAATVLAVDVYNLTSRKCFLTIRINQTDFDEQDGTKERIEFVKVNHNVTASDLKPGKNPCGEAIASGSLRKYEDAAVIQKQDVTDAITNGLLMVELKITDMVDECGVDEHLLDGEANVTCEG